jgi:hypothetical protein
MDFCVMSTPFASVEAAIEQKLGKLFASELTGDIFKNILFHPSEN